MKNLRTIGLLVAGLTCFYTPVWAEKADRDQPMLIEANAMRHDETLLRSEFSGQVIALKGTMVLRGAHMTVQQDKAGHQITHIFGGPNERVFFRQKREGLDEFTEGEGELATYDSQTNVLTLSQRAELRVLRGTSVSHQINGQTIVFNNTSELITVDGLPQGGKTTSARDHRVRAVLSPRKTEPVKTAIEPKREAVKP